MYEKETTEVRDSLVNSGSSVFTDDVINQILSLTTSNSSAAAITQVSVTEGGQVTVPAGTEMAQVTVSDSGTTTVEVDDTIPVVIFQSSTGGVNVTLDAGTIAPPVIDSGFNRVVVGAGGDDVITVVDTWSAMITAGSGHDTVIGGAAGDSIVGGAGNDSLSAGLGDDTIVAGDGSDTVDGGVGFDVVSVTGSVGDYTVAVQNGQLVMSRTDGITDGIAVTLQNVQYVQLDNGQAVVATKTTTEAAVVTLYETLLGRTAEAAGMKFWLDQYASGKSLNEIAAAFISSSEGSAVNSNLSDEAYIASLYQNTLGREGEAAGMTFWKDLLSSGQMSRADIAASFASVAAQNLSGELQGETNVVTTVGYVNIISDLI